MATAAKKASKKRKAKKARKSPAGASKKAAVKKRAAKSKRVVKKASQGFEEGRQGKPRKSRPKKAAKKVAGKSARKAAKKATRKPAKKSASKKRAVAPQAEAPVEATPAAETAEAITASAQPAAAAKPATVAERNTYFITTAIAYPNGVPHIGHAYEAIATDALARFQRLNGKDVFFLTGTDEHGLKMIQTAESEGMAVADLAARNAGRFREMDERLNVSFDRFIRTTEPEHHRSVQAVWNRMQQNGDIYIDTYAGWYSVRDEAYYAEEETVLGEDNLRRGPQGSPVEWVEEKSYFFKLSAYQDRLLALYENQPDFIGPDSRRNEVISFVRRRPEGSVDFAHDVRLGRQGAERPRARDVCLGRRPDQLHHRRRLSRRERSELALLAGGRAHHRQGHHPLPRGVLAGVPDVGRHSRAEAGLCPRLPVQQGREDVEVGRQRRRSLQSRRPVWRRPDALFLPARGAVRTGRQLQPRSHCRAHQCRSRQRSRQSGAALAVDDRKATRRRAARARRVHRQRQGRSWRRPTPCWAPRARLWRRSRSISG